MTPAFSMDDNAKEYAELEKTISNLEAQITDLKQSLTLHNELLNYITQQLGDCDKKLALVQGLIAELDYSNEEKVITPHSIKPIDRHTTQLTMSPEQAATTRKHITTAQYETDYLNALQQ